MLGAQNRTFHVFGRGPHKLQTPGETVKFVPHATFEGTGGSLSQVFGEYRCARTHFQMPPERNTNYHQHSMTVFVHHTVTIKPHRIHDQMTHRHDTFTQVSTQHICSRKALVAPCEFRKNRKLTRGRSCECNLSCMPTHCMHVSSCEHSAQITKMD